MSQMLELRQWQMNKILQTYTHNEQCPDNVLSNKLLDILNIEDQAQKL
jgi:hypothetical protein